MRNSIKTISAGAALFLAATLTLADTQEEADALLASQKWSEAATAYQGLLAEDDTNSGNWFSLGQARHQLEAFEPARDAFSAAIEHGYQPLARAQLWLARAQMALGNRASALELLEEIGQSGGPSHRALEATPEFAALADEPRYQAIIEKLRPCNTEEYRHFDFWLGEWDVTPAGATAPSAYNNISAVQDGCVVLEQYRTGSFTGMSINFYDVTLKKWHQTWMSNSGGSLYLEGGLNQDGAMEMTDQGLPISSATGAINKVTWTPNPDGSVRQYWQSSTDGGKTWSVAFDGIYVRKPDKKD
jgi:tetratricopeptide (TPR) repeat protein